MSRFIEGLCTKDFEERREEEEEEEEEEEVYAIKE